MANRIVYLSFAVLSLAALLCTPFWCLAAPLELESESIEAEADSPLNRFEVLAATPDRIRGRLTRGDIGVTFDSRKDGTTGSLVITTLQGKELIAVTELGGDVVASLDEGRLSAAIQKEDLLRLRPAHSGGALAAADLRDQLEAATELRGDVSAVEDVKYAPEYALLPSVSFELGKLGFTGYRHPPSMAVHAVGAAAAQLLHTDPRNSGVVYRYSLPRGIRADEPKSFEEWLTDVTGKAATDCWDPASGLPNEDERPVCPGQCKAFPIRERECFGMCGPRCDECWHWVCGDCCYHDFCATHDAALRACEDRTDALLCVMALVPWYFIVLGCG
jgi:hypothetical protein